MSVLGGAEPSNKTENRGNTAANHSEQTNIGTNHGPVKINLTGGKKDYKPRWMPSLSKRQKVILLSFLLFIVIAAPATVVPVVLTRRRGPSKSALATGAITTSSIPEPSHLAPTSTSTPSTATGALPPPASPSADSVHLVNSLKRSKKGSGYAYFADAEDGKKGAQPDGYAIATVNVYAKWENHYMTGFYPHTNITFRVFINTTHARVNAAVGEANNGYRHFFCYADDGRLLYKQNGTDFHTIYFCQ